MGKSYKHRILLKTDWVKYFLIKFGDILATNLKPIYFVLGKAESNQ